MADPLSQVQPDTSKELTSQETMMRPKWVFAVLLLSVALAAASKAETPSSFATYFGGAACYARTYDAAHLEKHTGQKVKSIVIDVASAKTSGDANAPESFEVGFAVKAKKSEEWYGQAGVCKTEGGAFNCFLEADGGLFRLTPEGEGQLKLETGTYGISIEGDKDAITLDGKDGDDKVFVLSKAKTECEEANTFFTSPAK